jgi:hypothetical protein
MNDEPKSDEPINLEIDLDERDKQIEALKRQMRGHNGVQRGPYIECRSCPFKHGWYIGMDLQLKGWDPQGWPMLEKIDI